MTIFDRKISTKHIYFFTFKINSGDVKKSISVSRYMSWLNCHPFNTLIIYISNMKLTIKENAMKIIKRTKRWATKEAIPTLLSYRIYLDKHGVSLKQVDRKNLKEKFWLKKKKRVHGLGLAKHLKNTKKIYKKKDHSWTYKKYGLNKILEPRTTNEIDDVEMNDLLIYLPHH